MRVFVSEYITSGALSARPLPDSLLREGRSMLSAVAADLLRVPGCHVATTLDRRLPETIVAGLSVDQVEIVSDEPTEQAAFDRLVKSSDATLVIAPETDGILVRRVRRVLDLDGQTANCSPEAIEICGDKWNLAQHLEAHGIPTIPTGQVDLDVDDPWTQFDSSCVLKPRDGAGSWLTFHVPQGDVDAWQMAVREFRRAGLADRPLLQPFFPGWSVSAGCLCYANGRIEVLPVGRQHIDSKTFQYHGGRIPAAISDETHCIIENLIRRSCATIPCLRGYIGFDLILPEDDPRSPVITEINPRLTTSYVGYRQLCCDNLAERLLEVANESCPNQGHSPLRWNQSVVCFLSDGTWRFDKSLR